MEEVERRWPTVFLADVNCKVVFNALLDLFVNMEVPSVITNDQGMNFMASLPQAFMKLMGCSP